MDLLLITSGAYLAPEFTSEFGLLPPTFLPVGNRRLFVLQADLLRGFRGKVVMTLPENFEVDQIDLDQLEKLNIEIIRTPLGVRLGESIVYALNINGVVQGNLKILHGDTLIHDLDFGATDVFAVSQADEYYNWATYRCLAEDKYQICNALSQSVAPREVLSGYFSFSNPALLIRSMTRARGEFVEGLNLYNQDQGMRPLATGTWLDFGHIQKYYRSRSVVTTQRGFNSISVAPRTIRKTSAQHQKLSAEAYWYQNIPAELKIYTPHFISFEQNEVQSSYELENLYLAPLNDLFVFGRLPLLVWKSVFEQCDCFLTDCLRFKQTEKVARNPHGIYLDKTMSRLTEFSNLTGLDLSKNWHINGRPLPSLERIAQNAASLIGPVATESLCVVHGDFCFSNIFYDFRVNGIRVVDPRGLTWDGIPSIYGDNRYDVAKLYHSIVGRYDFIMADHFDCSREGDYGIRLSLPESSALQAIEAEFQQRYFAGHKAADPSIHAMAVLLFLSMLPLHKDNIRRQFALLANALRMYLSIESNFGLRSVTSSAA